MADFPSSLQESEEAHKLIADQQNGDLAPSWFIGDSVELRVYVRNYLHTKGAEKDPIGHPVYERMNLGPQFLTRAAYVFLSRMWPEADMGCFTNAKEFYGFADSAPLGINVIAEWSRDPPDGWDEEDRITTRFFSKQSAIDSFGEHERPVPDFPFDGIPRTPPPEARSPWD
jgi:hypothetical protein